MKKKNIFWIIPLLVLGTPIFFIYLTFSNSTDCSQLVIDTYELHSGINIPRVDFVNCYYDEKSNTRISVYDLKADVNFRTDIDLNKFELISTDNSTPILKGFGLLTDSERPNNTDIYLASGEKWDTKWTYLLDVKSKRIWAELNY